MSEFEKLFRDGEALKHDLEDYWHGVAGEGDLGYEWQDKPHRLVFDLISAVLYERYRVRAWEELHAKDTELLAAERDRWRQLAEKRHKLGLSMVDKLEKAEARADEWASMYESIKLDTYKVALQRDEARARAEKAEAEAKQLREELSHSILEATAQLVGAKADALARAEKAEAALKKLDVELTKRAQWFGDPDWVKDCAMIARKASRARSE